MKAREYASVRSTVARLCLMTQDPPLRALLRSTTAQFVFMWAGSRCDRLISAVISPQRIDDYSSVSFETRPRFRLPNPRR